VHESTQGQHNSRGWLLHFDATLAQLKTPGSFGWDDTASVVPAAMVPGYTGNSSYLLMTKYNNYGRSGSGDSKNRIAVLDPNSTQADMITPSQLVMKEVLTILGPTPDPSFPGGVTEWCINTAAVDPFSKSIIVNSEDGYLYRWDLTTNTLSQKIKLTSGLGESYTPTAVGADGLVYAINNAVLFAVGK
jgi:WD40 repeat protein